MEQRMGDLGKDMGLTSEQQEKIKALRSKQREKTKGIREKLQTKMKDLKEELERSEINKRSAYKTVAEISVLRKDLLEERVNSVIQMRKILTPEQFQKLQDKRASQRAYRQELRKRKSQGYKDRY